MTSDTEYRIRSIIILASLLLHFGLIIILFVPGLKNISDSEIQITFEDQPAPSTTIASEEMLKSDNFEWAARKPGISQLSEKFADAVGIQKKLQSQENEQEETIEKNEIQKYDNNFGDFAEQVKVASSVEKKGKKRTKKTSNNNFTLADLTQSYLSSLQNDIDAGNDAIGVMGDSNAKPTEYQLQYERYVAKLLWHIQQQQNIQGTFFKLLRNEQVTKEVSEITFIINKDGSVSNINVGSCGCKRIDDFFYATINEASKSFPPLPSCIKKDKELFCIYFFITKKAALEFYKSY